MLQNLRIGPRLIAAFMVLVLISIVIAAVGLYGAGKIDGKAEDLYHRELMGLSHIKEPNIKLVAILRARSNFLLATRTSAVSPSSDLHSTYSSGE